MAKTQKAKSKTSKSTTTTKPVKTVSVPTKSTTVRRVTLPKVSMPNLALGRLLAELVGTFVLTYVVLASISGKFGPLTVYIDPALLERSGENAPLLTATAVMAAVAVAVMHLVASKISGAHFNPALTLGFWVARKIKAAPAALYIVAQLLGAMLAVVVVSKFVNENVVTRLNSSGGWEQFFAEALGALILGFGVASIVYLRKEGLEAAVTLGGSLLLAIVVAGLGSNGLVNPALALGVGSLKFELWSIASYVIAPILGAIIGVSFFKLVQNDSENTEA